MADRKRSSAPGASWSLWGGRPRARETAPGRYAIEGMKFQMGGFWYVEFRIAAAPGRDTARVSFTLPEA